MIVGRGEVGKTCLKQKLMDPDYEINPKEKSTEGVQIKTWPVTIRRDDRAIDFTINFWDFGGQEIYHATHQFFLTKRSLYLLVWEARKDEDLLTFDYWLNTIRLLSDSSPVLLVMNKADERSKEIEQQSMQKEFSNIRNFYKVSALDGWGLSDLRDDVRKYIGELEHIGDRLPRVWLDIRDELKALDKNYISYDDYLAVCKARGLEKERADFLSDYLHDLGAFLHFRGTPLLEDVLILRPEWGTNAVYNVLDNEITRDNQGTFSRADLRDIWKEYPSDMRPHLLQLMQKFELCFQHGTEDRYTAPELMPADQPAGAVLDDNGAVLRFEYRYTFMPAGIITRFIVRKHENISREIFWKNGVLLQYTGAQALVISEPRARRLRIAVSGAERKAALYDIRSQIDYIHGTLNNPDVQEMLPCVCSECVNAAEPVRIKDLLDGIAYTPPAEEDAEGWDVFISHSNQDKTIINEIINDLRSRGVRYWVDHEQIDPGDSIVAQIERGLKNSRHTLLCFSQNQLKSGWCRKEYETVLNAQISGNTRGKLLPLILDDLQTTDLPFLIRDIANVRYGEKEGYERMLGVLQAT